MQVNDFAGDLDDLPQRQPISAFKTGHVRAPVEWLFHWIKGAQELIRCWHWSIWIKPVALILLRERRRRESQSTQRG